MLVELSGPTMFGRGLISASRTTGLSGGECGDVHFAFGSENGSDSHLGAD